MQSPVIDEYGFTYESEALVKWLVDERKTYCPMTGKQYSTSWLAHPIPVINLFARLCIIEWWEKWYADLPQILETTGIPIARESSAIPLTLSTPPLNRARRTGIPGAHTPTATNVEIDARLSELERLWRDRIN